jgi:hypothetical protein
MGCGLCGPVRSKPPRDEITNSTTISASRETVGPAQTLHYCLAVVVALSTSACAQKRDVASRGCHPVCEAVGVLFRAASRQACFLRSQRCQWQFAICLAIFWLAARSELGGLRLWVGGGSAFPSITVR